MADNVLLNTIEDIGEYIILSSETPYENVNSITGFTETVATASSDLSKQFRWGPDNITFSEWYDLTIQNFQTFIPSTTFEKFFVEYKYELNAAGDTLVQNANLVVTYVDNSLTGFRPFPIAYSSEKGTRNYPLNIRPFSYNPYAIQNPTIKLYKDLSYIVNQMYGHDITYVRAVPLQESRDVILGEYTLYNYGDPQCIKVIVPNNEFPDNKMNINAFGADYEIPFEVQVDKRMFESIFGHAVAPQKLDVIYFPLVDRMYQIMSTQLMREFMKVPIYWKMSLVKYQDQLNIGKSQSLKDSLEQYTTGIEEMVGGEQQATIQDVSNVQQMKSKNMHEDPIRDYVERINDIIVQETVENYYTVISQYNYNLNILYKDTGYLTAIRYKPIDVITNNSNRTYTWWFRPINLTGTIKQTTGCVLTGNSVKVSFGTSGIPNVKVGDYLKLYKVNTTLDLFGQITEINPDPSKLYIVILVDDFVLSLANTALPTWASSTLSGTITARRNLLWNYNSTSLKGIIVDLFENKFFRIILNEDIYWLTLSSVLTVKWYGLVLTVLNEFGQLGFHLYDMKSSSEKTTVLNLVYEQVINSLPQEDRSSGLKYEIIGSPISITNFRVLNEQLEKENHSIFLNQNIIRDASHAIIIDNSIPRLRLPYIGNSK